MASLWLLVLLYTRIPPLKYSMKNTVLATSTSYFFLDSYLFKFKWRSLKDKVLKLQTVSPNTMHSGSLRERFSTPYPINSF